MNETVTLDPNFVIFGVVELMLIVFGITVFIKLK